MASSLPNESLELARRAGAECKSLRQLINGNLASLSHLNTTEKSNLVAAINEVLAAALTPSATTYAELTDKTDVDLPAINTPLATALAGKAPTSHTHPASQISDATATGRSILTAANQAAARSSGLGSGATGDLLFQALTPAAARETLGVRTFTKPSNESRSSTTTYAVDSHLKDIPLEAGKSYKIEFYVPAYVPSTEGGKVRLLLPLSSRATVPIMNGAVFLQNWGNASGVAISTSTTGAPAGMRYFLLQAAGGQNQNRSIAGVAYTDVLASAGNLSLEWAQNTSGVNATILLAGSTITVTEL